MKQIYILILLIFPALAGSAQRTLITFNKPSGNWSSASNWSPSRLPRNNDSVVIPKNKTVVFDQNASYNNMYVNVAGTLTIQATMTLDAFSAIELKSTGIVDLGSGGNVNTEMIVLGGAVKFDQSSNNPTTGPAAANAYSDGFGPVSVLPVIFSSFCAKKENNHTVSLAWVTSQEVDNRTFEVQRSADGQNWTVIATFAGAGSSDMAHSYRYSDNAVTGAVVYYRIRQVDINGDFQISFQKVLHMDGTAEGTAARIVGYNKSVTVQFSSPVKNTLLVRVMSLNGQVMAQQNIQRNSYVASLSLSHVNTGVYLVQISDGESINESAKVVL